MCGGIFFKEGKMRYKAWKSNARGDDEKDTTSKSFFLLGFIDLSLGFSFFICFISTIMVKFVFSF